MEQIINQSITVYMIVMSLLGFAMMGIDKHKARRKSWRIPERTLFLVSFLGGGLGTFLGMYFFRHKTKHTKFVLLLPLSAVMYAALLFWLYNFI